MMAQDNEQSSFEWGRRAAGKPAPIGRFMWHLTGRSARSSVGGRTDLRTVALDRPACLMQADERGLVARASRSDLIVTEALTVMVGNRHQGADARAGVSGHLAPQVTRLMLVARTVDDTAPAHEPECVRTRTRA